MHNQLVLVGNPNAGKSSLFNLLTGLRQSVGNFPGVTVERRSGRVELADGGHSLIDLPGVYSLVPQQLTSADERVTLRYLARNHEAFVINVVDATTLERHLYLSMQLRELGMPMLLVLAKADLAAARGIVIDQARLQAELGCPVIALDVRAADSRQQLLEAVGQARQLQYEPLRLDYGPQLEPLLATADSPLARVNQLIALVEQQYQGQPLAAISDVELLIAETRYQRCSALCQACCRYPDGRRQYWTDRIDHWLMQPLLAIPLFLASMYLMFAFAITIGGIFIDFFDQLSGALLVDGLRQLLESWHTPELLIALLADGLGRGVQTVSTFIPIIGCLFLFLTALEQSGYLARAATVVDRLMQKIGLPGSAFVPMLMGFGCTVPAVMATRTLKQQRERVMTAAMSHFMSCGARLPVFALFAAALFPSHSHQLVFLLYVLGLAAAVITGLVLRRTLLAGSSSAFLIELPDYQWPRLREMLLRTWQRLKGFIFGAGKTIVVVVALLSLLNTFATDGSVGHENSDRSLLALSAKAATPLFAPMGLKEENWQATVGIITGIFAKEVVVGTLNALYQHGGDEEPFALLPAISGAFSSVVENAAGLGEALLDPLGLAIVTDDINEAAAAQEVEVSTVLRIRATFSEPAAGFAYLLFILLYVPCASATGAMVRELGGRWAALIALWSTALAYLAATVCYQASLLLAGQWLALLVILVCALLLLALIAILARPAVGRWLQGYEAAA